MEDRLKDRLPCMPTLSALILAGGQSRRMGADKALLSVPRSTLARSRNRNDGGQQPLLLRTVEIAQQVTTEVAIVTPWPARYRSLLAATDVRLLQEPSSNRQPVTRQSLPSMGLRPRQRVLRCKPSAGPMSGFAYGWQHITSDWCLLLACDLPYLEADQLTRWWHWIVSALDQNAAADLSADVPDSPSLHPAARSVPMASLTPSQKGWEPLCGFYHRSCLPSLTHQLATARQAFQPWLQQIPIARYDHMPTHMFFNCNTPSQWQSVVGKPLRE